MIFPYMCPDASLLSQELKRTSIGRDEILSNQYSWRWLHLPCQVTQLACPSSGYLSQLTLPRPLHVTAPPSFLPFSPSFWSYWSLIVAPPSRSFVVAPPLRSQLPASNLVFPASIPPHLINVVNSRAQVPLLLRMVWGMPVAHWE